MSATQKLKKASAGVGKVAVKSAKSKGSVEPLAKKPKRIKKQDPSLEKSAAEMLKKHLMKSGVLAIGIVETAILIHDAAETYEWAAKILKGILSQFKTIARDATVLTESTLSIEDLLDAQKALHELTEQYIHVIEGLMDSAEKISEDIKAGRLNHLLLGQLQTTLLDTLAHREIGGGKPHAVKAVMNAYLTARLPNAEGKPRKTLKL